MGFLSAKCPHCYTEKVSFVSVGECQIDDGEYLVFFLCRHCNEAITVKVYGRDNSIGPHKSIGEIDEPYFTVGHRYPYDKEIQAPDFTPKGIEKSYIQAVDNLLRGHFEASGMMFRRVLDVATKSLGATEFKLKNRIDALASDHRITPAMQEWAHVIRLDGNEAAHEEESFDKETCEALKSFTELFLMYAFTLPGMLAERRATKIK